MHRLSDINLETLTATCSECGPDSRIKPRYGARAGKFRCYAQWYETTKKSFLKNRKFADGTDASNATAKLVFDKQNGRCAICSAPATDLDHCHQQKKIRGYLCRQCNLGLGMFKDNPELLEKAIKYLNLHNFH